VITVAKSNKYPNRVLLDNWKIN